MSSSDRNGLMELLSAALDRVDPVPDRLQSAAADLAGWIDPDASLAKLVAQEAPAVRAGGVEQFEYEWPDVSLTLQVRSSLGGARVTGLFTGRVPSLVRLDGPGRAAVEVAPVRGSFEVTLSGPAPFVVSFGERQRHVTRWIVPKPGSK